MEKTNVIPKIFDVKHKNIVLTGASGTLGSQYSHFLSAAGANMILVDLDDKKNKMLEKQIVKKYHTKCKSYLADISNKEEIKNVSSKIISEFRTIDGLINNAGFTSTFAKKQTKSYVTSFEEFPLELWNKTLAVNLTGVFLCSQEFGKVMAKRKKGVIINIASHYGLIGADQRIYGKSGLNLSASYAASKAGIVNLTRYLASYWRKKNIRVNTLTPGGVLNRKHHSREFVKKYSERTILNRMANENEYNGAILFLISDASSYMTGGNLVIDGGWTAL
jgi:NAD(P)-dependent dehydrogenase (short-subunit alcohol dehydrogenase family)|tara:strand:- start:5895 stop:6725 length:831 start_codon:yes stop_codon:yes gene_type:complete